MTHKKKLYDKFFFASKIKMKIWITHMTVSCGINNKWIYSTIKLKLVFFLPSLEKSVSNFNNQLNINYVVTLHSTSWIPKKKRKRTVICETKYRKGQANPIYARILTFYYEEKNPWSHIKKSCKNKIPNLWWDSKKKC